MESYRNAEGKPTSKVLYSLGKGEDYKPEDLLNIGIKFFELGGGDLNGLLEGELFELGRYNYGYQMVFSYPLGHFA